MFLGILIGLVIISSLIVWATKDHHDAHSQQWKMIGMFTLLPSLLGAIGWIVEVFFL